MGRVLRGYTRLLSSSLSDLIATIIEIMVSFLSAESYVICVGGWWVQRGLVLRVEDLNSMWDKLKRFCGDNK